jgi:hypothetical protein
MHRVLPPSEPLDGERPCCFRLAVVGGTQLRGSWYLSAIARLQGFSSGSPTASPRRWSPKMVTTSLMVGRSKPGCGLCPALSFKYLHHPCWGGGQAEPELYLPHGFVGHLLLQHSGERALTSLAEGADFDNAGPSGRKRRQLQHDWFAGLAGSGTTSGATSHRWAECGYRPAIRAAIALRAPGDRPRRRALLGGVRVLGFSCPCFGTMPSRGGRCSPVWEDLSGDLPTGRRLPSSVLRWWRLEKSSSPMRSPLPSALRASALWL